MFDQGVPGRQRGARQRRTFFDGQWCWTLYDALLLQHHVFRQHAVDTAAEGARLHIRGRLSSRPALEEAPSDLVADLHTCDAATDLDHLTGAVGKRDDIIANRHPVGSAHDAEIAEVERTRHDLDQHLPIGGLGIGALDFDQGLDAGTAFWQLIGTHLLSFPELIYGFPNELQPPIHIVIQQAIVIARDQHDQIGLKGRIEPKLRFQE